MNLRHDIHTLFRALGLGKSRGSACFPDRLRIVIPLVPLMIGEILSKLILRTSAPEFGIARSQHLVLAAITFNQPRAVGFLSDTDLGKGRSDTFRRKLISIPGSICTSARKVMLHLPENWPRA